MLSSDRLTDTNEIVNASFKGRLAISGEHMTIYVKSAEPSKFYIVELSTTYNHPNSQTTDDIYNGYNYTEILQRIRDWEKQPKSDSLKAFLQKAQSNLSGVNVHIIGCNETTSIPESFTSPNNSYSMKENMTTGSTTVEITHSLDTSYGALLLERLKQQPLTFNVAFETENLISTNKPNVYRVVQGLINELFCFGSNGSAQVSSFLDEGVRLPKDYPVDHRYPMVDTKALQENPRGLGMFSFQTLEHALYSLNKVLTTGDTNHVNRLDPARKTRLDSLVDQLKELNIDFRNLKISIIKNPQYPDMDHDTMFVEMSIMPNGVI
jgi:hypothetical protein